MKEKTIRWNKYKISLLKHFLDQYVKNHKGKFVKLR